MEIIPNILANSRSKYPNQHKSLVTIGPPAKLHKMAYHWRTDSDPILRAYYQPEVFFRLFDMAIWLPFIITNDIKRKY